MHQLIKLSAPLLIAAAIVGWQIPSRSGAPSHREDAAPASVPVISPVKPLDDVALKVARATIDKMVNDQLSKQSIKPLARTSDEVFLRRVYLDLIGRIPTAEEANNFLSKRSSNDKREKLVQSLIGSEGYVSHQYNFWADLLRVSNRLQDRYPGQPYIDWLKQSLRENKPYDQMVSEMLQAEGPALARGNGATGYYVRDAGMPLDNMSNTIQVFLGTQLACAQCHNHPNDTWTRMEYFQMAAFTSGTSVEKGYSEQGKAKNGPELRELKKQYESASPQVRNSVRMLRESVGLGVKDSDSAAINLPHDYQYADAKAVAKVSAHAMFGEAPAVDKGTTPRASYTAWMLGQARFSQVIANRMWKKVMGTGLIEPVDNLRNDTVASNPELMEFLSRLMVTVKYDLRKFQEIIYTTEAYQREAVRQDVPDEAYAFQGAKLRRLTAEQVWDSLMTLAISDIDTHKGGDATNLHELYEKHKDESPTELFAFAQSIAGKREEGQKLRTDFQDLKEKLAKAKDGADRAKLIQQMKELGERRDELLAQTDPMMNRKDLGKGKGARDGKGGIGPLIRASELSSPAPSGHFLRTFGQSDRLLIDNSTDGAAVTQALSMMNGLIEPEILSTHSVLTTNVQTGGNAEAKAKILWLTILSREPTRQEITLGARVIASQKDGVNDLAWALINSHEFLFVR
jgi:Protein of unknown function (DUF1549)/Protein of unknown function (DUF1553)